MTRNHLNLPRAELIAHVPVRILVCDIAHFKDSPSIAQSGSACDKNRPQVRGPLLRFVSRARVVLVLGIEFA